MKGPDIHTSRQAGDENIPFVLPPSSPAKPGEKLGPRQISGKKAKSHPTPSGVSASMHQ